MVLGLGSMMAVVLLLAQLGVAVYENGLQGFKAPPVESVRLSEPLYVEEVRRFGGSGGQTSTWALVSSSDSEVDAVEQVRAQALGGGWTVAEVDCGGDTPPCREVEGTVLTDGDGAYLTVYRSPPSSFPGLGEFEESPQSAWIQLVYEAYGVGRCCAW